MKRSHAFVLGVIVVLAIGTQVAPDDIPAGIVLKGVVFGSATGLLAVGLVLTYRTTRVINFAYGAMGILGGALATTLADGQHWNWAQAAAAGVAAGVLVGALVERLIIRRFTRSPRLVLTVATIGLAQLLAGIAIYLPGWLGSGDVLPKVTTPLSKHTFTVEPQTFTGDDLLLVAPATEPSWP